MATGGLGTPPRVTRQRRSEQIAAAGMYWLVLVVLAVLMLGCIGVVASTGLTGIGLLALVIGLVCAAVLLSYAGSMRSQRRAPPP